MIYDVNAVDTYSEGDGPGRARGPRSPATKRGGQSVAPRKRSGKLTRQPVADPPRSASHPETTDKLRSGEVDPTERQKKFCDCLVGVEGKNAAHRGNYNPYAVCAASTGTTYRKCSDYYDWSRLSEGQLAGWLEEHGEEVSPGASREEMLEAIRRFKEREHRLPVANRSALGS